MHEKHFIVDATSSYTVEADTPDAALGAVLPMVTSADSVSFSIREAAKQPQHVTAADTDPYANLTKSAYKAAEVAEILRISRGAVYAKLPCIRVGSRRLYSRAAIIEVLRNGFKEEEQPIRAVYDHRRRSSRHAATVVKPESAAPTQRRRRTTLGMLTVKDAAKALGLSYGKAKELFESRKIYHTRNGNRFVTTQEAIEHFLKGKTPLEFIEYLVDRAKEHKTFGDDTETLEMAANELRKQWAE